MAPPFKETVVSFTDIFMITSSSVLSAGIRFVVLTIALYIARVPEHRVITSLSRVLHNAMCLTKHSVMLGEHKIMAGCVGHRA